MAKIHIKKEDSLVLCTCVRCGQQFKAQKATDYCPECASVLYEEQMEQAYEEAADQALLDSILPPIPEDKLVECVAELVEEGNQWALQASIDDPLAHQVAQC